MTCTQRRRVLRSRVARVRVWWASWPELLRLRAWVWLQEASERDQRDVARAMRLEREADGVLLARVRLALPAAVAVEVDACLELGAKLVGWALYARETPPGTYLQLLCPSGLSPRGEGWYLLRSREDAAQWWAWSSCSAELGVSPL